MTPLKKAELFAKTKHGGDLNEIGISYSNHLENVVSRLKSLGVIDEEVLCAGWLQGILEHTDTSFDELFEKIEFPSGLILILEIQERFIEYFPETILKARDLINKARIISQ